MDKTRGERLALSAHEAIVALGSNVGDKVANLDRALGLLEETQGVRMIVRSRNYQTPPWGKTDQDWFLNACALVETDLMPHPLLYRCLDIEREMGRKRAEKWGPRIIDLDLLVYGSRCVTSSDLVLPHPHITARAFVLAPLADIAPGLMLEGRSVSDWLAGIDRSGVEPLAG